ncbi:MAG: kelch repeat-containing protein, partial [Chitinophagaceae bacterium]
MKLFLLSLACLLILDAASAQSIRWTWVGGDSIGNNLDVYGNRRVFDSVNKPGSLAPLNTWVDKFGNLYMFGGMTTAIRFGFDTIPVSTNALWKYSPVLNQWSMPTGDNSTYPGVSSGGQATGTIGSPSPANTPGYMSVMGATWTDSIGNRWMFGGKSGYRDFGSNSNLWKYDIYVDQWTCIKIGADDSKPTYTPKGVPAASASPGARTWMLTWKDKLDRLYFFGGYNTIGRYYYGDVWMFDPGINLWTWQSGNQWASNQPDLPVHGASGEFSSAFTPGVASSSYVTETINSDGIVTMEIAREVWQYSVIINQWAWISGDRNLPVITPVTPPAHYGQKGVPSIDNTPGSRSYQAFWTDNKFTWIYGGEITTESSQTAYLSDLWKYNRLTKEWTWVDGDSTLNKSADYGQKGIPGLNNQPGGRNTTAFWTDLQGNHWLFGGLRKKPTGQNSNLAWYRLNDLWKLAVNDVALPVVLNEFSASPENKKVRLNWLTSQEQNIKEFLVQRSTNGINFITIGKVISSASPSHGSYYKFTDEYPGKENFYRLKIIEWDNSFLYSSIKKAGFVTTVFAVEVNPNPVLNLLRLEIHTTEP